MKMYSSRSEGVSWGRWIAVGLLTLGILGAASLAVFGSTVHPKMHEIRQVLSNDRFPT